MNRFDVNVRGRGCEGVGFGFCDGADDVFAAKINRGECGRGGEYVILLPRGKRWTLR